MIDIVLLGTGAMMPLPGRWLSAMLLRCRGRLILFDCGEGTQVPWRMTGWGFRRLDAICLSHLHADHVAGLPGVLHTLANADRTKPLTIYGPVRTEEVVTGLRVIAPDLPYEVRVRELSGGDTFSVAGGLRGSVVNGDHRVPCLIYRLDLLRARRFDADRARALGVPQSLWRQLQHGNAVRWATGNAAPEDVLGEARRGLAVGYMTDTRPVPDAATFLSGVDLLVSEGTYALDEQADKAAAYGHMTFAQAASIARDAGVGRLWLTHFSSAMDEPAAFAALATSIFPATEIGRSHLTATLNFIDEDQG